MVKYLEELLKEPFSGRSREEKLKTLLEGKPRPVFPNLSINNTDFDVSIYNTEMWITACEKRKSFYCWACLLFAEDDETLWTTEGYSDLEHLSDGVNEHNSTVNHISSVLKMRRFVHENINLVILPAPNSKTDANKFRKRTLIFMSKIVSRSSFLPPNVNEFHEHIFRKCADDLTILKRNEKKVFEKAIDYLSQPEVLTSFLATLASVVKRVIKEEILNSPYVSIIINEHSCDKSGVIVSIVLRYLINEKVCERFVEFDYIQYEAMDGLISRILQEWGILTKSVTISLDSPLKSLTQLQTFVNSMKHLYGFVLVPCYFHCFETIIERRASKVDIKSRNFFKVLTAMKDFLNENSQVQNSFKNFLRENNRNLNTNQSSFKFIRILKENKELFSNFFKAFKQDFEEWTADDVMQAHGFFLMLKDPYATFFIETYFALSSAIVQVNDVLHSSTPERILQKPYYEKIRKIVFDIRARDFQNIWNITSAELEKSEQETHHTRDYQKRFYTKALKIFNEVMNSVIEEIKIRIESIEKYRPYLSICTSEVGTLGLSRVKNLPFFPMETINLAGLQKDITRLHKEYQFLLKKQAHDVLEFMIEKKLQNNLSDFFKVLQVIRTIPCKAAVLGIGEPQKDMSCSSVNLSRNKTTSKLDAINPLSKIYQKKEKITNDWSLLSIEQSLLTTLLEREQFCWEFYALFERDNPFFQGI